MSSVEFWSALASISTFALLVVTGVYAFLTYKITRAAEHSSWEVNRAIVSARLNVSQRALLGIVFENLGKTPATNLKIQVNHPVFQMVNDHKDISEVPMIKHGLENFPPNFPVELYLGTTFAWLDKNTDRDRHPSNFVILLSYSTGGKKVSECVTIDVVNQLSSMGASLDSADDFFRKFPDQHLKAMDRITKKIELLSDTAPPPIVKGRSWSAWFHQSRSRSRYFDQWK